MIYNADNGALLGITENCTTMLGVPSSLVYGNSSNSTEFRVDLICSDLMNLEKLEELRNVNSIVSVIDTTIIEENFIIKADSD